MKLRKGDTVKIVKGKDKDRTGKIEKVFPRLGKVLIPGVNLYKKHVRARSEKKPGGIIEVVKPLSIANVALLCSQCHQPTRVGYQIEKSGEKQRICKKCKRHLRGGP